MPTLNKNNFSFFCNNIEKTVAINLNNYNEDLKNYSALLVAHDEHGEIIIKTEAFKKNGESNFKKVTYPIFCLIISQQNCNETKKYFSEQREALAEKAVRPSMTDAGDLNFYFSTHKELISTAVLDIILYYSSISNSKAALGLLVFNNSDPYKPSIDTFYEFSEIAKGKAEKKEILEKLNKQRAHLEQMKHEIEAYIDKLIDSPEKNLIENLLGKINLGISYFDKHIKDKNNFLNDPILPINRATLNLLIQGFEKIKTEYPAKEDTLKKNEEILLERKNFITQSISYLKSIQSNLKEKKEILAGEDASKISESEKEIAILIEEFAIKERNIASLPHEEYSSLTSEYAVFLEKITAELTNCTQRADTIISERKTQLRKAQNKFADENKIDIFKKTLTDEITSEFEKQPVYSKYTELLTKTDNELTGGCISLQKVEELKKEIAVLSPQLKLLKETFEIKNKKVIQARKEKISRIQLNLSEIEDKLTSLSKELYGIAADNFSKREIDSTLQQLTIEIQTFHTNKTLILNKKKIDSIRKKAEEFKADFESKVAEANKKSDETIRTELHNLQQNTSTLKATDFFAKVNSLLTKPKLTRSQLENVLNELLSLKKTKIKAVNNEIVILEEKIKLIYDDLYGPAKKLFEKEAFATKLIPIKEQLTKLLTDKTQLSEYAFDSIDEKFKAFEISYETKIKKISAESKQAIKAQLSKIRACPITQENEEFSKKIDLLIYDEALVKNKLDPIINEFNRLRLDAFSTRLDNIREKLDSHIKSLEGKNPINLLERLINLIARTVTKEKIEIEKQGVLALDKLKEHITNPSSHDDTATLDKYCQETDSVFKNESLMTHRSFLFFKFNPVTSERIAKEATELLGELKTAFKI